MAFLVNRLPNPLAAAVFRFAPSPNGFLHRGHAFSAVLNARAAAATGGRFLLRMEDVDASRARPHFAAAILEELAWLGLSWEKPVLRQSDRLAAYADALRELEAMGLVYPAFLSRREIAARAAEAEAAGLRLSRDPDGAPLYPGDERDWPAAKRRAMAESGAPYTLRLDVRRAMAGLPAPLAWRERNPFTGTEADAPAEPASWGDVVLSRRDSPASYHLAVVIDDAFQGITHVVRGQDLKAATAVHRTLQALLGLPEPDYFHHALIRDDGGDKLGKSRGSPGLRDLRAGGISPAEVLAGLPLPPLPSGP